MEKKQHAKQVSLNSISATSHNHKQSSIQFNQNNQKSFCTDFDQEVINFNERMSRSTDLSSRQIDKNLQNLNKSDNIKNQRLRRTSFLELEHNKKSLIDKLIREESLQQETIEQEEEDDVVIYSADLYTKAPNQQTWKNRELKSLTTKKIATISVENITKIKFKTEQPMAGYNEFILTTIDGKTHNFAIRQSCVDAWFSGIIWVCLVNLGFESCLNQKSVQSKEGMILKKGQFFGKWEERYVKIDKKNGLQSGNSIDDKTTLKIKQTSQLWTRLERIQNNKYVVIKLWHHLFKIQFGVPTNDCSSWLRAFSTLITQK